ncbi:hypothetical protein ES332_A12G180600v1 [Gossypium tomentosum]|uniref:Uncharacterized protein n=1 Tax=Gossypium tomentosum TaxID=34277 RepID=A0A5D2MZA3_GOSTO|nr:hypothetical protein ES332_A12G180600v1 [Gossypium tomentosum]
MKKEKKKSFLSVLSLESSERRPPWFVAGDHRVRWSDPPSASGEGSGDAIVSATAEVRKPRCCAPKVCCFLFLLINVSWGMLGCNWAA